MRVLHLTFGPTLLSTFFLLNTALYLPKRSEFGIDIPEGEDIGGDLGHEGTNPLAGGHDAYAKDHPSEAYPEEGTGSSGGGDNAVEGGRGELPDGKIPVDRDGVDADYDAATEQTEVDTSKFCKVSRRLLARVPGGSPCFTSVQFPEVAAFNKEWDTLDQATNEMRNAQLEWADQEIDRKLFYLDDSYTGRNQIAEIKLRDISKSKTAPSRTFKGRDLYDLYQKQMSQAADNAKSNLKAKLNNQLQVQAKWCKTLKIDPAQAAMEVTGQQPVSKVLKLAESPQSAPGDEFSNVIAIEDGKDEYYATLPDDFADRWWPGKINAGVDWSTANGVVFREQWGAYTDALKTWTDQGTIAERTMENHANLPRGTLKGILIKIADVRQGLEAADIESPSVQHASGYVFKTKGNTIIVKNVPLTGGQKAALILGAFGATAGGAWQIYQDNQ